MNSKRELKRRITEVFCNMIPPIHTLGDHPARILLPVDAWGRAAVRAVFHRLSHPARGPRAR